MTPAGISCGLRLLIVVPSFLTIGFGAWPFTVPIIWDWWAANLPEATELVLAVRAINVLFLLLMCLLGVVVIAVAWRGAVERYALGLVLFASVILWGCRLGLQLVYPKGTQIPVVAPAMLITFAVVLDAYVAALIWLWRRPE